MIKYVIEIGTGLSVLSENLSSLWLLSHLSLGTGIPKALFFCAHIQLVFYDSVTRKIRQLQHAN